MVRKTATSSGLKTKSKNCSEHKKVKNKAKKTCHLPNKIGRWENWECMLFLDGLKIHGKGKWKQIALLIPTRLVDLFLIELCRKLPFAFD